jgi:hypothetical protein
MVSCLDSLFKRNMYSSIDCCAAQLFSVVSSKGLQHWIFRLDAKGFDAKSDKNSRIQRPSRCKAYIHGSLHPVAKSPQRLHYVAYIATQPQPLLQHGHGLYCNTVTTSNQRQYKSSANSLSILDQTLLVYQKSERIWHHTVYLMACSGNMMCSVSRNCKNPGLRTSSTGAIKQLKSSSNRLCTACLAHLCSLPCTVTTLSNKIIKTTGIARLAVVYTLQNCSLLI